ncbi:MAG: hypothetical protein NVSMB4_05990 [Acidimicrobiales bacterium]
MRIRSIKPEFWTSEDVASLPWEHRLLFIGLWSYVDDNGVGRDVERLIASSLFPLEEDPRETLATVSRGLQWLSGQGLVTRYEVDGRPLLHITAWDKHQRIDKPNKKRYEPPTCENAVIRETLAESSRDSRDIPAPGAGEQGSRGAGEQGITTPSAPPPREDVELLCKRLHDRVTENGSKAEINAGWRNAARLMLDRDHRDLDKALRLIDWCQDDSFWSVNILSMPTFRAKYDQLRLKANAEHTTAKSAVTGTTTAKVQGWLNIGNDAPDPTAIEGAWS